jgi:TolA-binding protein
VLLFLVFPAPAGRAEATPLETAAHAFAREEFAEVLKQLPRPQSDAEANLLRGRALLRLGRYAEAEAALRGLVSALPELRDLVLFLHAEALLGMKRYPQAAARFRDAARSRGSRFIYLSFRRRSEALLHASQWGAAAAELRHLIRTQSENSHRPDWQVALALCLDKLRQRRQAAELLREVWLSYPMRPAAARARKELDRLLRSGVRIPALSLARRVERIRLLRREKLHDQTLAELAELRKDMRGPEVARIDFEAAMTHIWANQPAQALAVLRKLPVKSTVLPGWHRRALIAACMARTGKVTEAARLLLQQSYRDKGPLRPHERAEVARAAVLLAEHGHYEEALGLRLRLAGLARKLDPESLHRLAWLSYRAGRHDEALQRFEEWAKRVKSHEKDYLLYWQARIHGRAGRTEKAEALYREIVEKFDHTYYGLLARSRLAEAGKLKLRPGRCQPSPTSAPADRHAEVLSRIAALKTRYGDLLPEVSRAHALWRLGMLADARRELRLLAIRVAWVAAKGRPRSWIQRPSVERLWRGGPLERRRWGKAERELAKEGAPLRHAVGALLEASGISYFGWKLGQPDPDPERRRNPRAYPELVQANADRFKLDPNLIWAIMRTESSYRLDVISRVGATGLMQIMPHTARRIAAAMNLRSYEHDQLFEPETNLMMSAWYLQALVQKFNGQIPLVAAGYNGGPHHVGRWLDMRGARCDMDEFIEEIPFSESRRYAKKILRLLRLYERVHCGKDDLLATNKLDPRYLPDPNF